MNLLLEGFVNGGEPAAGSPCTPPERPGRPL